MGVLLHFVQQGGDWAGPQTAQAPPRCTKCNNPPINGQCSVPITVLLYNGPLLCGFNVPIKGLISPVNMITVTLSGNIGYCVSAQVLLAVKRLHFWRQL